MYSNAIFENEYFELNEQELFTSILYHASSKGNKIRMSLHSDGTVTHYANRNHRKLHTMSMKDDIYTTLNTFASYKRVSDEVYAYTGIYIDLDAHNLTGSALTTCLNKTKDKLAYYYEKGSLSRPTMIVETGRGLGIYYVLDRSIANVEKAQKSIKYLNNIRARLTNRYEYLLKKTPGLMEVDHSVSDPARVVRVPGTFNQKGRAWCHIADIYVDDENNPVFYDLKSLAEGNYLFDAKAEIKRENATQKITFINEYKNPFLSLRLKKLSMLQELRRNKKEEGYREYACFIYYNAATQIYGAEEARKALIKFNDGFINKLSAEELEGAMRSVDKRTFYKLTDAWIIDKLGITEEENELCKFGCSKRQIERLEVKEANQKKREERNQMIGAYVASHEEVTYKDIAKQFGVSESTVRRIAKTAQIRRYKKQLVKAVSSMAKNVQKMSQYLLGVLSPKVSKESLSDFREFYEQYSVISMKRRERLPVPGQLKLIFGGDGSISYG